MTVRSTAMRRRDTLRSRSALPALLVLVVSGLTVTSVRFAGLASVLAASPQRVGHGRVWLLVTSGLLAERPVAPSIVSFAFLAGLTRATCGSRVFWGTALAGHVFSTLIAYGVIAVAWALNSNDLRTVIGSHDYGVSAVSAAWLGAIAAAGWRTRGQTSAGRVTIVLGCVALALFAYILHPGVTIFASEHVIAFAIGAVVGAVWSQPDWSVVRSVVRPLKGAATATAALRPPFAGADPFVAVALLIVVVLVGGSVMSNALAQLPSALAETGHLSAGRCVDAWNRARAGSTLPWLSRTTPVLVVAARDRAQADVPARFSPQLCSYLILGRGDTALLVNAQWRHDAIGSWQRTVLTGRGELPTNAALGGGTLQLDPQTQNVKPNSRASARP